MRAIARYDGRNTLTKENYVTVRYIPHVKCMIIYVGVIKYRCGCSISFPNVAIQAACSLADSL